MNQRQLGAIEPAEVILAGGRTLAQCEAAVESALATIQQARVDMQEFADALMEIKDRKLYKVHDTSWERYCTRRWGLSGRSADRQIEVARAVAELEPGTPTPSQRELARNRVDNHRGSDAAAGAASDSVARPQPQPVANTAKSAERSGKRAAPEVQTTKAPAPTNGAGHTKPVPKEPPAATPTAPEPAGLPQPNAGRVTLPANPTFKQVFQALIACDAADEAAASVELAEARDMAGWAGRVLAARLELSKKQLGVPTECKHPRDKRQQKPYGTFCGVCKKKVS